MPTWEIIQINTLTFNSATKRAVVSAFAGTQRPDPAVGLPKTGTEHHSVLIEIMRNLSKPHTAIANTPKFVQGVNKP